MLISILLTMWFVSRIVCDPTPQPNTPKTISLSDMKSATTYTLGEFNICSQIRPKVFALIYVHSAPDHFMFRSVIRRTFGSGTLYSVLRTVTVFFIGQSLDENVAMALKVESDRYHDIIQGAYVDSYKNLSLKAISALKWLKDNCSATKYVLKVDDDIFVNVFNLVRHLRYMYDHKAEIEGQAPVSILPLTDLTNTIHCLVWDYMTVLRVNDSKWYVSKEEYSEDIYPVYCSGIAFFMEWSLISSLFDAVYRTPFLWVDDIYITGLLAKEVNVTHNPINSIMVIESEDFDQKLINGEAVFGLMEGNWSLDIREMYWKRLLLKRS